MSERPSAYRGLLVFFSLNYLAQGLSGFVYEPISFLLKDSLGLSPAQSAAFISVMTLPFLFKPVFGALSDFLAVRGLRRRPHLFLVSLVGTAAWIALACLGQHTYALLLALLLAVNVGVVGADVVCDGVMVEQGRRFGKTGLFQAVQIGVLYLSLVVTGVGGGWLVGRVSTKGLFLLAAAVQSLTLFSAYWISEPPAPRSARPGLAALAGLAGRRRFWAICGVIFLWSFAPFLGTAQFYYQSVALGLDPVFIGLTSTIGGAAGAAGAAFYGRYAVKRWTMGQLLRGAVLLGAPMSLLYLLYLGRFSVGLLSALFGFVGVTLRLALMDAAARSCPPEAEATAFASYMAVFNLAASASNMTGGALYQKLSSAATPYVAVAALSALGCLATAACWPLLPWALGEKEARA